MYMTAKTLMGLWLTLWMACTHAASLCPSTKLRSDWSAECFESKSDGRHVKATYRNNIHVDRRGVALIVIGEPREVVAVDRRGKVVVPGIEHTGDFDLPYEHNHTNRYWDMVKDANGAVKEQCGYFSTRRFRIVVPAQFDACHAFHDGVASACKHCARYCTEPECQNSVLIGGQGYQVKPDGSMQEKRIARSKEQLCSRPDLLEELPMGSDRTWLRCREKSIFRIPSREAPAAAQQ
jgi:hypothetical protein